MEHTIRHHFGEEHAELERRLEGLRDAAEGADAPHLVEDFRRFERGLTAHMDAEEKYLFPALETDHPDGVRKAREDHAKIRACLEELGMQVELHTVRLETVEAFLSLLKAHKDAEDAGLYRAADDALDAPGRAEALAR